MKPEQFVTSLLAFARPHGVALAIGILLMSIEAALALALPWLGGRFADAVFADRVARGAFASTLLGAGIVVSAQAALAMLGGYLLAQRLAQITADIRRRVYEHMQRLPLPYFEARRQGEVLSALSNDVHVVGYYLGAGLVSVLPAAFTALGALLFMAATDPPLAAVAAVAIPMFYLLIKLAGRGLRPDTVALQQAAANALALEEENISMLPAIKAAARESFEARRHDARVSDLVRLTLRLERWQSVVGPALAWLAAMSMLALLWLLGERASLGPAGVGSTVTVVLYAALLTRPVGAMATLYGQTQHARAAMARLQALLDTAAEPVALAAPALCVASGDIRFTDVRFTYPGRSPVLERFTLHVEGGKTTAITGHNGVGKSTVASLLLRFNVPAGGRIEIDGQDIANVALTSLRRAVGYVPQRVFIVNGTVRENIAYAMPDADDTAIRAAAELAQASQFIAALPQGLDTIVGDHGVRLSGGQRQRLALARALLPAPPILILDEATAMFDPDGELDFLRDCQRAFADRTVLLITHRSASMAVAHRIIRLEAPVTAAGSRPSIIELTAGDQALLC